MRRLSKRLSSSKLETVVPVEGEPSDLQASGAADEDLDYYEDDFESEDDCELEAAQEVPPPQSAAVPAQQQTTASEEEQARAEEDAALRIQTVSRGRSSRKLVDETRSDLLLHSMQELAFGLHTQEGSQYRNFDTTLVQRLSVASSTATAQKGENFEAVWNDELLPAIRQSRFPLVVWEPEGTLDVFRISHLSFQEYLCASRLIEQMKQPEAGNSTTMCKAFVKATGVQKIESLLGSDRYQVIVQMGRELLAADTQQAEAYANCFLPPAVDEAIRVEANLSTATAAITLFSLVSCRQATGITLR